MSNPTKPNRSETNPNPNPLFLEQGHSIEPITDVPRIPMDSSSGCQIQKQGKMILNKDATEKYLREYKTLAFDRALNPTLVEDYMKQMMGNRWRGEQTTLMSVEYNSVIYRLNGQHVCSAYENVVAFPKHRNLTLLVNYIHYKVSTEEELRRVYGDTDAGKKRTTANKINVYLLGSEAFPDLTKKQLASLATGLRGHVIGFTVSRVSVEELYRLMVGIHHETCVRVGEFLKTGPELHIRRGPVYSAMISTFEKYKEASTEFWSKVSSQAELASDDPRLMLAKKLSTTSVSAGRGGGSSRSHTAAPEEMYRWCINAFNAWKNGTVLTFRTFNAEAARPHVK